MDTGTLDASNVKLQDEDRPKRPVWRALKQPNLMTSAPSPWPGIDTDMARHIRAFDWALTPLGPIAGWPQSLKTVVDLMLRSTSMMSLVWGAEAIHLYNDSFTELLREHRLASLGKSAYETFARSRDVFADDIAAGMAGRSKRLIGQRYPVLRNGRLEDAWFDVEYAPVHDETGRAAGVLWTLKETTAQYSTERALRASEEHLAAIFGSAAVGLSELTLKGRFLRVNDELCRILGRSREEILRLSILDVTAPEDVSPSLSAVEETLRSGNTVSLDKRYLRPDGSVVWANSRLRPLQHSTGQPSTLLAVTADLTDRRAAGERLRESEERFRQFAEASSGVLWVRDAETLEMEYASRAIQTVYGVLPETFLNGVEVWASAIVPDDRAKALGHLEKARQGEAVVHEFRIQRPLDGAFRWIRNTDFPLLNAQGQVQRIGGIAEDVTEAKLAVEHQGVLLAELQHRVRNIMAQIRSITARTGERAESVVDYADLMAGRLMTLARVQALLTREANVGARIVDIVHDELAAQAAHAQQYTLDGPGLVLAPKAAELLTLAVHELTTNALKYGGLSVPEGRVTVRWGTDYRCGTPWLGLDWLEEGAPDRPPPNPSPPRWRGFGSELIEGRIPYELGGRGELSIGPGGARCRLEFPLQSGPSVLETDAPRRAVVYGGALDMTGEADLTGHRILVVEDDYYLATDTARALKGAGAEVIGPCPTEEAARSALSDATPTGAVLDLNLGDTGPSFTLAAELRDRMVPFIMVTGYDAAVVPAEFETIARLQKPVQFRQIVDALATALDVIR